IWLDADPAAWSPLGPGCVFANELLDALPVHRVVVHPTGVQELFVDLDGTGLAEIGAELSTSALATQITAGGGRMGVGQRAEVSLRAPGWAAAAARLLERGYVL